MSMTPSGIATGQYGLASITKHAYLGTWLPVSPGFCYSGDASASRDFGD